MLLSLGVLSLVGTLGAPNLASAATNHATAATHATVARASASHKALPRTRAFDAQGALANSRKATRSATRNVVRHSSPATTPTLYVNGTTGVDTGSCRLSAHPCLTISFAITKAPATADIDVANDTYAEQLVDSASKDLTIVGASESGTIIEPSTVPTSDTDTDSAQPQYAIVDAQPGSTVNLSDVTVDGANASTQFTDCTNDYVGLYYHDASGAVTDVTVQNIVLPPDEFGCQDGLAVYVAADSAMTSNVTMTSSAVTNYDKNGITCDDAGTKCTVNTTTVTGGGCIGTTAQNGIQGFLVKSIKLTSDTVTGDCYSGASYVSVGILFYDDKASTATTVTADSDDVGIYDINDGTGPANQALTITGSKASSATIANGLGGLGIGVDSATQGTIESTTMAADPGDGLDLWGVSGMTVKSNTAKNDHDGIYVGGPGSVASTSTGNTVTLNKANHNSLDGIEADSDTSGNSFTSNKAKADLNYSYEDLSTGAHTAGTANTWTSDSCTPAADSSPEGLC